MLQSTDLNPGTGVPRHRAIVEHGHGKGCIDHSLILRSGIEHGKNE